MTDHSDTRAPMPNRGGRIGNYDDGSRAPSVWIIFGANGDPVWMAEFEPDAAYLAGMDEDDPTGEYTPHRAERYRPATELAEALDALRRLVYRCRAPFLEPETRPECEQARAVLAKHPEQPKT